MCIDKLYVMHYIEIYFFYVHEEEDGQVLGNSTGQENCFLQQINGT